jgi:hypothetical protein
MDYNFKGSPIAKESSEDLQCNCLGYGHFDIPSVPK